MCIYNRYQELYTSERANDCSIQETKIGNDMSYTGSPRRDNGSTYNIQHMTTNKREGNPAFKTQGAKTWSFAVFPSSSITSGTTCYCFATCTSHLNDYTIFEDIITNIFFFFSLTFNAIGCFILPLFPSKEANYEREVAL
ncbi:hypothetical protein NE237_014411 [Protea cynaroides]|uniref:Uncharacterized protein n=1 Tax=Protea cynaroides TaxID=273540 RepID=A0A9Q0QQ35_9MAGN|nr:hypothetical protein NE237_014411 [Protea cynaroides]